MNLKSYLHNFFYLLILSVFLFAACEKLEFDTKGEVSQQTFTPVRKNWKMVCLGFLQRGIGLIGV
jgi:hypothetical protein